MILADVEIFNNTKKRYELFEAIVDTGATFCAIARHIAEKIGLPSRGEVHLWQVDSPVVPFRTELKIRYKGKEYNLEGVTLSITEDYLRPATLSERCKRPLAPHPLSSRIIVGKNFLEKLTEEERTEILSYLIF